MLSMRENNTVSKNSPAQDTFPQDTPIQDPPVQDTKVNKNMHSQAKKMRPIITGVFWIAVGTMMLIVNFFPYSTSVLFIRNWGTPIVGIYLLLFSILGYMRKIYFIFAICIIALWIGHIIEASESLGVRFTWPITMIVISLAIIFYGFIFKKHKFKSYLITGCIFLVFSLLVLTSVLNTFNFSQFLKKGWPVFLILLGISYIYNRNFGLKTEKKREEKLSENHEEK